MRLTADGLEVTEIAPGIDLERDILAQAGTPLKVTEDLKVMDGALFQPGLIGLNP